jgi:hypothetical protein
MSSEAQAEAAREGAPPTPGDPAILRQIVVRGSVLLVGVLVALGVLWILGTTNVPASLGLIGAGVALVYCLSAFYGIVQALARPSVRTVVDRSGALALSGRREAREQRHRVLRAIKELDFDHAMGKISDEDFAQVRQGYELRAIEIMRSLESGPDLHPGLRAVLEQRRASQTSALTCSACDGANDADSRFCKHCGEKLE